MKIVNVKSFLVTLLSTFILLNMGACSSPNAEKDNNEPESTTPDEDEDYDDIEQMVFDSWIENNRPDLVNDRQEAGYYVEILKDEPDNSYPATNKTSCWVEYNITARDLDGNVTNTRNESMALLQNTFNLYTRYVPAKSYISLYEDEDNENWENDVFVQALRAQKFVIDGVNTPVKLTVGNKIRLWAPSRLAGSFANGEYGYSGQFAWAGNTPIIYDIEITNVVVDAEKNEREILDWFIESQEVPSDWEFVTDKDCNSVYINYSYTPNTVLNYKSPYNYTQLDRAKDFEDMESQVNQILVDVFGEGNTPTGDEENIIDEEMCNVWYITRTLDGFIVDSNIEEVKSLVHNTWEYTTEEHGSPLSYSTESTADSFISAFYYTIPKLEFGQWTTMITSSLEAYEKEGQSGSATSTTIDPYTTLIFQLYVEED